jgi:hypothetical protein
LSKARSNASGTAGAQVGKEELYTLLLLLLNAAYPAAA